MKTISVLISFFFVLLLSSLTLFAAGENPVKVFTPESKPYGLSYEAHVKNFWKHIISIPSEKSPWVDSTGEYCTEKQVGTNSSVFYLGGNGGGKSDRTCTMPAGKGLFIPVSPFEISDKEAPNTSVEDLQKIAKKDQDSITSLYLKIGDQEYELEELSKYRIPTGDFEVRFPKNGLFGATEGPSKAVGDGYYVITEPLAKGNYTVAYKSSLVCLGSDCLEPNFVQDIQYRIIAE